MHFSQVVVPVIALFTGSSQAAPHEDPMTRQSRPDNHTLNRERADAVKASFQFAWDGYEKYAFPNDELNPVSNNFSNSLNGWGASAVDAFSTALVMQIPEIVDTILEFIPTINFDETADQVSLFETTIRYLGGMLSGYDFLKGPLGGLASNATAVDLLLTQAERLASNLAFAFNTPTGIPSNNLFLNPQRTDNSTTNGIATIGTLVLEWVHLSDLSGNKTYGQLAEKGESYLLAPKPASSEPWPGLIGTNIDINTGLFQDAKGGWVGGADSFYEYLLKMYVYDSTRYGHYKDRWILAADSTIAHLASHPSSRPDLTFLAYFDGQKRIFVSQHLSCFHGGSFILGGLVLKEQKYIDFGLALVNGCHDTYVSTLTGIGPEVFRWVENSTSSDDPRNRPPPANQTSFYDKAGFFITNSFYSLRPEVIESFYYAYRATGDQIYRDWAWNAFVAIRDNCKVGSGFAELNDVNQPKGGGFGDFQDSFFFAEVLKYAYLIHSPDDVWQVEHGGKNEWVFNTEAHPFKVWGPPI
ncbi:related to class I alpha-mannosidase 1B [Rhynchosporium agropyri]|uniref:alpha-1,2-Mannosidase n=1 Tax=Rhynchosporium agropyri TaxID=914238 RepID=A0A1E1L317_9HELO|nr:related to class I alpha-mannosidase 1B [Rhynchosporium agropyri]